MPSRTRVIAPALLGMMLVALAGSAQAGEQVDPAAFPELAPEALLPAILTELRHTLPDVYSVREVRMCPARKIELKDGRPNDWGVQFEYNAKNENGGYTGIRRDVAIFRNRRIAYPVGVSAQLARTGLDGLMSRQIDRQMAACVAIPDSTIQQILTGAK